MIIDEVRALVDHWVPVLGLTEYHIEVREGPLEGFWAELTSNVQRKYAVLIIRPDYYTADRSHSVQPVANIERTVVHELMHLACVELRGAALDTVTAAYGEAQMAYPWKKAIEDAEERFVDRLSIALVKALRPA